MAVDSSSLMATQAPPDLLLGSEEGEKKVSPTAEVTPSDPPVEGTSDSTKDSEQITTEKDGVADSVVKKEESVEKEPQVESSKSADEGQVSPSADKEAVEAMETGATGTSGTVEGGDSELGDGGDGASESKQAPPTDDATNSDTVTSEASEMVEEASKGAQENKEGPLEQEESKGENESTEIPKEAEVAVSSPRGEEPVVSESMGESVEQEEEETKQEGEEQQQQVCVYGD